MFLGLFEIHHQFFKKKNSCYVYLFSNTNRPKTTSNLNFCSIKNCSTCDLWIMTLFITVTYISGIFGLSWMSILWNRVEIPFDKKEWSGGTVDNLKPRLPTWLSHKHNFHFTLWKFSQPHLLTRTTNTQRSNP